MADARRAPPARVPGSCNLGATLARVAVLLALAVGGVARAELNYRTSWIGNTLGYGDGRWVPNAVEAMAVTADGVVLTNTEWDEAGGEVTVIRDGKVQGVGDHAHGWGNFGGDAIAVGDGYAFTAARIEKPGGRLAGRPGYPEANTVWYGVMRREYGHLQRGAPFEGGVGNADDVNPSPVRNSFLRVTTARTGEDAAVRGLAVQKGVLFAATPLRNRIDRFDARTMRRLPAWEAEQPGKMAPDAEGNLWVILHTAGTQGRQVVRLDADGKRGAQVPLPAGAVPVDVAVAPDGRLLVADNGPNQNLLWFHVEGGTVRPAGELGERGGAFGTGPDRRARPGSVGPLRFHGLTSVGLDGKGNVYVAMSGMGPRPVGQRPFHYGAVLESYAPDAARRWRLEGLLFLDTVHVDPADPGWAYSGGRRFRLDFDHAAPGGEWRYAGITMDPFRYPDDAAFAPGAEGRGFPLMRRIQGRLFGFFTDRHAKYLKIYRFDPARSDLAVPAGFIATRRVEGAWPPFQPPAGEWIWHDDNGDARFQANEFERNGGRDAPPMQAWWADDRADVWAASFDHGIRRFRLRGLDRQGNPDYSFDAVEHEPMPAPFTRLQRLQYFPETDTMYLTGATAARPYDPGQWDAIGRVVARYDNWRAEGRGAARKPRYVVELDSLPGPRPAQGIEGIAVAGDYLFLVEAERAHVRVLENRTGRQVGVMTPGPEVGRESGWVDVPMGITALRRADGEYVVFVEEDARGKNLMYRWRPALAREAARP
ncbi:hypothetical protein [Cupriavidus campinensis]